ncbi:MAG: TetR/AcrR family transcriptional regulator [Planctomycetota bacterium]|nr:MAG: TetR/AcrR family transcriptional regulator [Planctomycetota bacterium]
MAASPESARKEELLEVASALFLRFGYRKTSMDDVARGAGLSRQGLYLHFRSKEALFVEALEFLMSRTNSGIQAALEDPAGSLEDRLLGAFDAYKGAFVTYGMNAVAMDELLEASQRLVGDRVTDFQASFIQRLAEEMRPVERKGISAESMAEVLYAVSAGLKFRVDDRNEYRRIMRNAIRLLVLGN